MSIFCYQHHINDWRSATASLTLLQRGVYREMLDWFYVTEGCLPSDPKKIARLIGAETRQEKEAIEFVALQFFCKDSAGFLQQKRAKNELERIKLKQKKASESAKIKHLASANAERTQCERSANHKPRTIDKYREDTRTRVSPLEIGLEFEKFWGAFPKKSGRKAAFTAYEQARGEGIDHARIIEGVAKYVDFTKGTEEKFLIPPDRWLRDGHYDDEHPAKPQIGKPNGKPAYGDSIKAAGEFAIRNIKMQDEIRQKARE